MKASRTVGGQRLPEAGERCASVHRLAPLDALECKGMTSTETKRQPRLPRMGRHSSGQARVTLNEVTYLGRSAVRRRTREAEAAFRIHKTELRIRPIWHQRADRVQAHILVCFFAYAMWKVLQGWQRRPASGRARGRCWKS